MFYKVFIKKDINMKRIIRLTEWDLTRLVKRTIMELDRSTYEKAADVAGEKGFNKMSDRFREHGKEFGLNQERDNITMVVDRGGEDQVLNVRINDLKIDPNYSMSFTLDTEDLDKGTKRKFELKNVWIYIFFLPRTIFDLNNTKQFFGFSLNF